jgi:hypothetical protein
MYGIDIDIYIYIYMSIFSAVYLITIPCALALFCNLSGCRTNMYQHVEAKHVPTSGKESAVVHVVYMRQTNIDC